MPQAAPKRGESRAAHTPLPTLLPEQRVILSDLLSAIMTVYKSDTSSVTQGYISSDGPTPRLIASAHPVRPGRTRYARASAPDAWLEAPHKGFVGAIINSMEDGRDRVVLAWPSRPDNGFVAAALALREARATSRLPHGTLAVSVYRGGELPVRAL
jgi:hypothetical protein